MKSDELFEKGTVTYSPEEFNETINKLNHAYLDIVNKLKDSIEYSTNAKEYSEKLQRELSFSKGKIENGIKKKMQTTANDLQKIVDSVQSLESFTNDSQSEEIARTAKNILMIVKNVHERLKDMNLIDENLEITRKLPNASRTIKKRNSSASNKEQSEAITEKEIDQPSLFSTEN